MSTTTNPSSLLFQLRQLVPVRPLSHGEALRIAELQANRLLELSGVTEPGTPSEIVENLRSVVVSRRADMPASGYSDWYKPHWLILLNDAEPFVRQRFTLMHEFKHVLDHPYVDWLYPSTPTRDSETRAELVADSFAASVLMPKRLVKRLWGEGQQRTADLAATFGVSEIAMSIRVRQLGLTEPTPRCTHNTAKSGTWRSSRKPYFRAFSTSFVPAVATVVGDMT